MRWSIARMLFLTTAVALALVIYSRFWDNDVERQRRFALGCYLAVLATASAVVFSSPPRWRRFWLAYSLFGCVYFVFVMRLPLLIEPESIERQSSYVPTTVLGILLGLFCAFLSLVLPGPIEPPKDSDGKQSDG